jgi:hypothetical protein
MANVGPYSDVLVVDMAGGLVVGAVAERLGGKLCLSISVLLFSCTILSPCSSESPV